MDTVEHGVHGGGDTMRHDMKPIARAYARMADEAHYRPAAPSDGFGNITVPNLELVIEDEILRYCKRWDEEETKQSFNIGVGNFETLEPLVFAIEAARNLCAGTADGLALELLEMAVADLKERVG